MGGTEIIIIWKPEAHKALQNIYDYVWDRPPQNAEKLLDQLIDFGDTLGDFPMKFVECRHKKFNNRNYRCAIYKKNWIFLFKATPSVLMIHNVIHAKAIS